MCMCMCMCMCIPCHFLVSFGSVLGSFDADKKPFSRGSILIDGIFQKILVGEKNLRVPGAVGLENQTFLRFFYPLGGLRSINRSCDPSCIYKSSCICLNCDFFHVDVSAVCCKVSQKIDAAPWPSIRIFSQSKFDSRPNFSYT